MQITSGYQYAPGLSVYSIQKRHYTQFSMDTG